MKSGAGLLSQDNISGCDHIFHRIADPRKTLFSGMLILVYTASVYQILIFTVGKYRNIVLRRDLHSFFVKLHVHHRLAVLADGRDPCLDHPFNIRQLFSLLLSGHRSDLQHMDGSQLLSLISHIQHPVGAVDNRFGIWHSQNGGKSSSGGRSGTAGHIFFMGKSRITQMYVKINKARHYVAAPGVYHFIRLTGRIQRRSLFLDHTVLNIKVSDFVSLIRGI